MGFVFFLLVNLTLFVRPMEIVPDLEGWRLYEAFILTSLVLSLPEILHFFSIRPLSQQPITICVLGLFGMTILSKVGEPGELIRHTEHFAKILVYYVLAVSLLNSAQRMKIFLAWLLICILALSSFTILQYHEVIQQPKVKSALADYEKDRVTGELKEVMRLQGTGIFQDPNEFCGILATAVPLCFWALSGRGGASKLIWLLVLGLSLYGIYLTRSRGGLLGLMAALGMLVVLRYGLAKGLLLGFVGLVALVTLVRGRATEISATEGTGQARIQLWSDWLYTFRGSPLIGNGLNIPKEDEVTIKGIGDVGHLAHNSYLQAYADWGFPGGTFFLSAFALGIWEVSRFRRDKVQILDPALRRMQPFLLAALVAYAVGILSLSMNDRVPTFLILSLPCTYPLITRTIPPLSPPRVTGRMFMILLGLSVLFLLGLTVFVRLFVNW